MKTYYKDFLCPTRAGVPDNSRVRAIEFAEARNTLGHNVISRVLRDNEGDKTGHRIYFAPGLIRLAEAVEAVREEQKR